MSFIIKKSIHLQDISVFQAALKPNLQGQLIYHHMRLNHRLRYLFQSKKPLSFLMTSNIYTSEFTLPKLFTNIEFVNHGKFATVTGHGCLSARGDDFEGRNDGFWVFGLLFMAVDVDERSRVESIIICAFRKFGGHKLTWLFAMLFSEAFVIDLLFLI